MTAQEELKRLSGSYFVDGAYQNSASGKGHDVIDPATEEVIGEIADCSEDEVNQVIAVANRAQAAWAAQTGLARAERMHEVATKMRGMTPVLSEMLTREMGKPYKECADEVDWSASAIDYYAEIGRHDCGRVVNSNIEGQFHYTVKEPMGVVVTILPFNFPFVLLCWEAAAALAAGNAVIVKPSELTTLSTLKFMEAFDALPNGVIQCISGTGPVGKALVESPDTHMVAFTGGVETGQAVAQACAKQFKPCLIEASGNDPFIVMPSAPLDIAVRGALFGANINCGQVCTSSERFFVHQDIHDEFVAKLVVEVGKLRIGNGLDQVDLGPMVNEAGRARYEGVLARAIEQGAKVACGGGRPAGFNKGWFIEPTVLTEVTTDMDIMNSESFGPATPICRVASFDEAIEKANDSKFGLGATVFTTDLNESTRSVNELVAGMVWVNSPLIDNDAGPFGGRKYSGIGRQLGAEGLDSFRHTKLAMIDYGCKAQDFWWFPYQDAESYPGGGA
ncbi:MAG: aldehyde dehydrogenase family protein [Alphaproteobacteria bacterium]|jgi:betaine-aldehyde dehydrogenase